MPQHSNAQPASQIQIASADDLSQLTVPEMQIDRDAAFARIRPVVVGGVRTPFARSPGVLNDFTAKEMAIEVVSKLAEKMRVDPRAIEEVVYGTVLQDLKVPNFAREVVLGSGLPRSTINSVTMSDYCITSLVTTATLAEHISQGRVRVGIAGGAESMSNPSLGFSPKATKFFVDLNNAKSVTERLKVLMRFRPAMLLPVPPSPKEPSTGLSMGQHCELTTQKYNISRDAQDQLALRSHLNAARAQKSGFLSEQLTPMGKVTVDTIVRPNSTIEKLQGLKPAFDKGAKASLTAGNSTSLTDGASAVMLMAESEARAQKQPILAYVAGVEYAEVDPTQDGLLQAPGLAVPRLLARHGLTINDIDLFEIHEAFAAQVLDNMRVWSEGWPKYKIEPIGTIPDSKININGGSLAIGHPFAATGARLVMSLSHALHDRYLETGKPQRGIISACAAGGRAAAILLTAGEPQK